MIAMELSNTIDELKIRHIQRLKYETVLVMQGGGSLGAYECGVFKSLNKTHQISFDVIAGTSIGAINAGIICGSKSDDPASNLENFWLDVSEKFTSFPLQDFPRAVSASMFSAMYGNPRIFSPRWPTFSNFTSSSFFSSYFDYRLYYYPPLLYPKPFLYDLEPLKDTLAKYIDFDKLNDITRSPRLIITCTDIKESRPVVFDTKHTKIDVDHLAACASFPFYGLAWTRIDGKYLWDGALLSNTPLREVIDASPKYDKKVYIVNLFPHRQEELPQNMLDVWHRARDIMHTDKTDNSVKMSKVVSKYLLLLKEMHDILSNVELSGQLKERFHRSEREYHKLADERGSIIEKIVKIERSEDLHFLFEDADFSLATIKKLIKQGEDDVEKALLKKDEKSETG
jgi:NTE family protein